MRSKGLQHSCFSKNSPKLSRISIFEMDFNFGLSFICLGVYNLNNHPVTRFHIVGCVVSIDRKEKYVKFGGKFRNDYFKENSFEDCDFSTFDIEDLFVFMSLKMNSVKLNPFWVNVLCPYPLKTSENQRIFDIFRMYRKETLALNGPNYCLWNVVSTLKECSGQYFVFM